MRVRISCPNREIDALVYFVASPEFRRNVVGRIGGLQHFGLGIVDPESLVYLSRYDG